MLILPRPRARILIPVPEASWREPSRAMPKDQLGNQNRTVFFVVARCHDGHPAWIGRFEDYADADAFLHAVVSGSIRYERELWRLPTPWWNPDLPDGLGYDFLARDFVTTPTGSNQTYTSKYYWNNSYNWIDTIGSGASGAAGFGTSGFNNTGGGGGAWNRVFNYVFSHPGVSTTTWQIGTPGASVVRSTNGGTAGNNGGDVYFGGTTLGGSSVGSKGGTGGATGSNTQNGGAGGVGASGVGTLNYDGGRGGTITNVGGNAATGGGGAAAFQGAGVNGVDTAASGAQTDGGAGDAGAGGAGGVAGGGTGGDGKEYDQHGSAPVGAGGGGAGKDGSGVQTAGPGGNYGAGGGASRSNSVASTSTSGAGIQGLIVLTTGIAILPVMKIAMGA